MLYYAVLMPRSLFQKIKAVIGGVCYDPLILGKLCHSYVFGTRITPPKQISDLDLYTAVASGKSLIRFGDGEVMLMTGRDIHYQVTSPDLKARLRTIISSYTPDSPYLLGVPMYALTDTEETLRQKKRLRVWRLFRVFFAKRFPKNMEYYCAIYFYYKDNFENNIAPLLKNRNVVCVAREPVLTPTLRSYFTDKCTTAHFVTSSPTNAFGEIKRLRAEIDLVVQKYPKESCTLILAAGPASKVLAYEYALGGVQSLDIGHGIEIIGKTEDYSARI